MKKHLVLLNCIIFFFIYALPKNGYSHGGEDHSKENALKINYDEAYKIKLNQINKNYIETVKSLFKKSCFDCHSTQNEVPWYGKIPGISKLINYDKTEGIKHLNLDDDFPFKGHGTPVTDLKAISDSIQQNNMPPLRYKVVNWNNIIPENEKKLILKWINNSLRKIEK
jgi:hypothetical protein